MSKTKKRIISTLIAVLLFIIITVIANVVREDIETTFDGIDLITSVDLENEVEMSYGII